MKKRLCVLALGGSLLIATGGSALAGSTPELPPSPIRQAAHLDMTCEGPNGQLTHGSWVSSVAQLIPGSPPIHECPGIITEG